MPGNAGALVHVNGFIKIFYRSLIYVKKIQFSLHIKWNV